MHLSNLTPFASIAFRQFDRQGDTDAVVSVRGRFRLVPGGRMAMHSPQPPFQWEDKYGGDPAKSCLLRVSDLTPYKPGTDVTYLGSAKSPYGRAERNWTASIRLEGRLDQTIQVTGPRYWRARTEVVRRGLFGRKRELRLIPKLPGPDSRGLPDAVTI